MGSLNRNFRAGLFSSIAAAVGNLFGNAKHKTPQFAHVSKHARHFRSGGCLHNLPGSKIRRAIRRGNHGLVNKHGTIGRAISEQQREKWLLAHNKPVIQLSTGF